MRTKIIFLSFLSPLKKLIRKYFNFSDGDAGRAEFLRYNIAGLSAAIIDILVYSIAVKLLNWSTIESMALSTATGLMTSYTLSIFYVFKNYQRKNLYLELLIFSIIVLIGAFIGQEIIKLMSRYLNSNIWISKALSMPLIGVYNAICKKLFLFNKIKKNEKIIKQITIIGEYKALKAEQSSVSK